MRRRRGFHHRFNYFQLSGAPIVNEAGYVYQNTNRRYHRFVVRHHEKNRAHGRGAVGRRGVRGEAGSEGDGGAPWRLRAGVRITTQDRIMKIQAARKFILTGRRDYKFPTINISDHMNVNRLIGMVKHCAPSAVITYHPGGACPLRLAAHLNKMGYYARALEEINTVIGI